MSDDIGFNPTGERYQIFGLDGEMSSAELANGGRLIQAGAAAWADEPGGAVDVFVSLIRPDEAVMDWSERAFQVHGITREELAGAPSGDDVDEALRDFLMAHGASADSRILVPVGLNVGSFDMPFFRAALPSATSLMARRCVDLNALLFTYSGWDPNAVGDNTRDFNGWKRSMKVAANTILARSGVGVREHDAGYDAAQALVGWWWLREQVTSLSDRVADLRERLNDADPLIARLGVGLMNRLAGVKRSHVESVVDALGPSVNARRWFGRPDATLGSNPLDALCEGRLSEVLALARLTDGAEESVAS